MISSISPIRQGFAAHKTIFCMYHKTNSTTRIPCQIPPPSCCIGRGTRLIFTRSSAVNPDVQAGPRAKVVPTTIFPSHEPQFARFPSRSSVVHSTRGIVACTQPLAGQAGVKILSLGGNAADAAVATAAALNVTEPMSTGIGGDMFCLFYDAKKRKTFALNGSGRSGSKATLEHMQQIQKKLGGNIPSNSVHNVTVPGCAAGWIDTVEKFGSGKISMEQILAPAIELAEGGFPVSEISSFLWRQKESALRKASPSFAELMRPDANAQDGVRAPRPGELFKNPNLGKTFRLLAKHGKKGFYEGEIAEALINVVQEVGGKHLTLDDLKHHGEVGSEDVDGISIKFSGQNIDQPIKLWEHPPNGQGLVALMALGMLEELEKAGKIKPFTPEQHNSPKYLHALIEVLRLAFSDGAVHIADPATNPVPVSELLSPTYLASRVEAFTSTGAALITSPGHPLTKSSTVYLAATDPFGNAISFINSNYGGFGTGIVPAGTGFSLQNRGSNFNLISGHANCVAPRKRPYHTIIPAMVTNPADGDSLNTVFGVMGGFMQPQGHLQVLLNMLVFKMNPQEALDAPRICIEPAGPDGLSPADGEVYLEEGIGEGVADVLRAMGHNPIMLEGYDRAMFGRGQVIRRSEDQGKLIWSAGSDLRGDGAAYPL